MGTDRHQTTITNLRMGINEAAHIDLAPGEPVPWQALSQIALIGCERPDGSSYRVYPDVFVYARPIAPERGSLSLRNDGPPVLVAEVLSEATDDVDLDLGYGKGYSYAHTGIPEYLAIDHTRRILPEGIRAWRLVDGIGIYQPWLPDANGRWHSEQIGVAISLEEDWASVYARDGRRILREGEVEAELARSREERASLRAEIERLRRLLGERS